MEKSKIQSGEKTQIVRLIIQGIVLVSTLVIVRIYHLYTQGTIDIRLLSIGDMNPYGGWTALYEGLTNSSFEFNGISRTIALTIALLTMSIIGGRFFCGWICPIGAIQDISNLIGKRSGLSNSKIGEKLNKLTINPLFIKYPILFIILLISIFEYGEILADISPWKSFLNLLRLPLPWAELKWGFIILILTLLLTLFTSRVFCKYLCPLGAAQALFSSFSILKLEKDNGCNKCNSCLKDCPVGIKLNADESIISPECIRCLKCTNNCIFEGKGQIKIKKITERRYVLLMIAVFIILWLGLPKIFPPSYLGEDIPIGNLKDGKYIGDGRGFGGKLTTEVVVKDGKISEINVLKHRESKGWYEEVFMVIPREVIKRQRLTVDVVSGATKSSRGLIDSISKALMKAY